MKRFFQRLVSLWKHTDKEVTEAQVASDMVPADGPVSDDASFTEISTSSTAQQANGEAGNTSSEYMATRTCMNCDEVLTGEFCFSCGQKVGDIRRPIWSLMSELLDNVVAPDSKLFKTILLLLAVPGGLTRDYNRGMRARFIPPLRFYITVTFLFFALLLVTDVLILDVKFKYNGSGTPVLLESSGDLELDDIIDDAIDNAEDASTLAEAPNDFVEGFKEGWNNFEEEKAADAAATPQTPAVPATAPSDTDPIAAAEDAVEQEKTGLDSIGFSDETLAKIKERVGDVSSIKSSELTDEEREELIASFDKALPQLPNIARDAIRKNIEGGNADVSLVTSNLSIGNGAIRVDGVDIDDDNFPYDVSFDMFVKRSTEPREGIRQEDVDRVIESIEDDDGWAKDAVKGFAEAVSDPREFNDLFNDLLPKIMFFMVPFFALILRLFHWGNKRFYFNQLIFSLHFHSFLFLIFIAFIFILPVINGAFGFEAFWWGTSLYLIISLKIGQEQGWLKAFFKAGFIWVSYAFFLTITIALSAFIGLSGRGFSEVMGLFFKVSGAQ